MRNVHHVLLLMLAVYLGAWVPFEFIGELLVTGPSLDMRGLPAVGELVLHGGVAVLSVTAGWMLWVQAPAALPVAAAAAIATGGVSIQSVLWTVLPRNIAPGEAVPLMVLACVRTVVWLGILGAAMRGPLTTSSTPPCR